LKKMGVLKIIIAIIFFVMMNLSVFFLKPLIACIVISSAVIGLHLLPFWFHKKKRGEHTADETLAQSPSHEELRRDIDDILAYSDALFLELSALLPDESRDFLGKEELHGRIRERMENPDIQKEYTSFRHEILDNLFRMIRERMGTLSEALSEKIDENSYTAFMVQFEFLGEILNRLLLASHSNIDRTMEPLSREIFEIQKNTNIFLKDIMNWKEDLTDSENHRGFTEIEERYQLQIKNFQHLHGMITEVYKKAGDNLSAIVRIFDKINENVSGIKDIASNIKTLSLNASVEAARAGSYGKGFKVIANEVKVLSDNTSEFLENITGVLRKTHSYIRDGESAFSNGSEKISAQLDYQVELCRDVQRQFGIFQNDFFRIFNSASGNAEKIFSHIENINPVFQMQDLIVQELENTSLIIQSLLDQHKTLCRTTVEKAADEERTALQNNFVSDIEKIITTDREVDILREAVDKFGLKRRVEIKKGKQEIELF
jgi:hypothetical protein